MQRKKLKKSKSSLTGEASANGKPGCQDLTSLHTNIDYRVKTPFTIIKHYVSDICKEKEDSKELQDLQESLNQLERQISHFLNTEGAPIFSHPVPIGKKNSTALILPLNRAQSTGIKERPEKEVSSPDEKRIFIVENSVVLRDFLIEYLSDMYTVTTFSNGLDTLVGLKEGNRPDLIISDVYMDKMNGMDLLENIKNLFPDEKIPFIFISGDDTKQMRLKGLAMGALDYIAKPFTPEELKLKISSWFSLLSQMDGDEKNILTSLKVDFKLTPRESQVAVLLLKGVPRKNIQEELYISANTVKTHISSIYSKCKVKSINEFFNMFHSSLGLLESAV